MLHHDFITHYAHASAPQRPYPDTPRPETLHDISQMLGRQLAAYSAASQSALAQTLGLPLAQVKALELVVEFNALPTGQLAHLLGISAGGATALINRLEAAGFVRRSRHSLDRRIVVIQPVEEKCAPLLEQRAWIATEVAMLARRFDARDVEAVHAFLEQCVRALRYETQIWLETGVAWQS
ncbi:MarR family transcriptional regulator [Achromobacter sp. Marseille-Q4962]|uniref:MarR family winged helix-turn-helix transcriptional regulator n=1 Tax=Achromobacter sp. Marseille-Q4962 TaxID=2942202 RepID=UPI0020746461|nr:MarR family transcriptional regulator [Achromobacter sp. Marseille-Q4962]